LEYESPKPRRRGNQGYVGPEAYMVFGALFKKKKAKLGTKVNMY
jgi:hypothetical protein